MVKKIRFQPADFLIILLLFHLVGNIIWIKVNNTAPSWDPASHTAISFNYYSHFKSLIRGNFNFRDFLTTLSDNYGPLARIITAIFLFLTHPSIKLAQFTNTVYFIMVLVMIYKLGEVLYSNKWIGVLGAFVFSFYQIIYDYSRWLWLDMLFLFFLLVYVFFLLESNFLEKTEKIKYIVISAYFAILTKFQAVIFLFFPAAYTLILFFKRKNYKSLLLLIKTSLKFLPLPLFWLIFAYKNLWYYYFRAAEPRPIVDLIDYADPRTWLHYLKLFIDYEITVFGFFIFLVTFYFYIKSSDSYRKFLFLNIIFYYVYFTFFPNKDMRFLFPILPYISLIFSKGLIECFYKKRSLGIILITSYIFFHVVMYFALSFGFPLKKGLRKVVYLPYIEDIVYVNLSDYPVKKYDDRKWPYEEILEDLKKESKGEFFEFVLIPSYENFNANDFKMFFALYELKNIVVIETDKKVFSPHELNEFINRYNYYLYTSSEVGTFFQLTRVAYEQIRDEVKKMINEGKAIVLKEYFLPTGEYIAFVKKTN